MDTDELQTHLSAIITELQDRSQELLGLADEALEMGDERKARLFSAASYVEIAFFLLEEL